MLLGTQHQLLYNIKTLVDVLVHMENSIIKKVTENSKAREKIKLNRIDLLLFLLGFHHSLPDAIP